MANQSNTGKIYVNNEDGTCSHVSDEQLTMYHAVRRAVGAELADKLFPHVAAYVASLGVKGELSRG